jgi:coenzyme F420-0:L-glutamate ligase
LTDQEITFRRGDILAVASKIVSTCEGRVVKLSDLPTTPRGKRIADAWGIDPRLCTAVIKEADQILGGAKGFLLTVNDGILTPNAGLDLKNSPPGTVTLWPVNPDRSASQLRRNLERRYHKQIGVEIVDSHVTALRLGTVGLAIGVSGFVGVQDHRGVRDLFGRPIRVTQSNVADDLAAAAHFLMGESTERVGAVLIRGGTSKVGRVGNGGLAKLNRKRCLIGNSLTKRHIQ